MKILQRIVEFLTPVSLEIFWIKEIPYCLKLKGWKALFRPSEDEMYRMLCDKYPELELKKSYLNKLKDKKK